MASILNRYLCDIYICVCLDTTSSIRVYNIVLIFLGAGERLVSTRSYYTIRRTLFLLQ